VNAFFSGNSTVRFIRIPVRVVERDGRVIIWLPDEWAPAVCQPVSARVKGQASMSAELARSIHMKHRRQVADKS